MLYSKLELLTSLPCLSLLLVDFSPGTSILKRQMNKVFYAKSQASFWYISLTCRHPRVEASPPALIPSLETTLPTPVFLFLFSTKLLCKFAKVTQVTTELFIQKRQNTNECMNLNFWMCYLSLQLQLFFQMFGTQREAAHCNTERGGEIY